MERKEKLPTKLYGKSFTAFQMQQLVGYIFAKSPAVKIWNVIASTHSHGQHHFFLDASKGFYGNKWICSRRHVCQQLLLRHRPQWWGNCLTLLLTLCEWTFIVENERRERSKCITFSPCNLWTNSVRLSSRNSHHQVSCIVQNYKNTSLLQVQGGAYLVRTLLLQLLNLIRPCGTYFTMYWCICGWYLFKANRPCSRRSY